MMEVLTKNIDSIFLPGEILCSTTKEDKIRIGAGLIQTENGEIQTVQAGKLCTLENLFFIETKSKKYIPRVGDMIIGTITEQSSEFYKLDIGASSQGYLQSLSFDGASRRNKPPLKSRDLVYCRVLIASRDMDPEVTCFSLKKQKDWVTGECEFGDLKGGHLIDCSIELCKKLLDPNNYVLKCLGDAHTFEIVIGMNGRVWIHSESTKDTIIIANAILNSENLTDSKTKELVKRLWK
jgi:exosome complex component RRP40